MNNSLLNQSKNDSDAETNETTDATKPVKPKNTTSKEITSDNVAADTTSTDSGNDTSSVITDVGDNGDIIVRKNELLGEKVVQLVNLDGTKAIDSIRSKEAGIKEDPGKSLTVEFWQSPLNSKGYTMSRSRLVLFGFSAEEQVSIYKLENSMFMKIAGGVFRLENTADFRQMERVTDEALLAKLP